MSSTTHAARVATLRTALADIECSQLNLTRRWMTLYDELSMVKLEMKEAEPAPAPAPASRSWPDTIISLVSEDIIASAIRNIATGSLSSKVRSVEWMGKSKYNPHSRVPEQLCAILRAAPSRTLSFRQLESLCCNNWIGGPKTLQNYLRELNKQGLVTITV
jgi:hypothetical protein